jgi:hypothetical protein
VLLTDSSSALLPAHGHAGWLADVEVKAASSAHHLGHLESGPRNDEYQTKCCDRRQSIKPPPRQANAPIVSDAQEVGDPAQQGLDGASCQ